MTKQVEQARHGVDAATAEIGKAQAGHAPGLDLSYTYSITKSPLPVSMFTPL